MTAAIAFPRNTASTFLTHFFGSGLADEHYVVERFKALACDDIRRVAGEEPATTTKRKRGGKRTTATLNEVKELRPARTEIMALSRFSIQLTERSARWLMNTRSGRFWNRCPGYREASH